MKTAISALLPLTSPRKCVAFVLAVISLAACSPKVYVIDNQTVLEEEAAGAWPQFEKQVIDKAKAKGPTPLSQVPPNKTRERLYHVLNGDMPVVALDTATSTTAATKTATTKAATTKAATGKPTTKRDQKSGIKAEVKQ